MRGYTGSDVDDKKPAYDLRRIYAEELVGDTLKKIKIARETRQFALWFNLIRIDLLADVMQKFTTEQKEEINAKIKMTSELLMKYPQTYLNKDIEPTRNEIVLQAILSLELLMKEFIEDRKIYGGVDEDIGL
jgi:hypothetical protein